MEPIDPTFLVKAAAGIIDRKQRFGDASKASGESMQGIQAAVAERIGAGKRIMYKLIGQVTTMEGQTFSRYRGLLVPEQNVVQLIANGMFLECPACSGQHLAEVDGQLWLDITPNACPASPKFLYTECPICPFHNQRKVIFDLDPAPEETEELFVHYSKLDKEGTLFGVLSEHVWGKHTQEARIRRWALPRTAPDQTPLQTAAMAR